MCVCARVHVCAHVHICVCRKYTYSLGSRLLGVFFFYLFSVFSNFLTRELNHCKREWRYEVLVEVVKSCIRMWLMKCLLIPNRPCDLNLRLWVWGKEWNVLGSQCKSEAVPGIYRKTTEKDIRIMARICKYFIISIQLRKFREGWDCFKCAYIIIRTCRHVLSFIDVKMPHQNLLRRH